MKITTRALCAVPLAAAALSMGTAPSMAETALVLPSQAIGPGLAGVDIAQPDPEPEPDPIPDGPGDIGNPEPDDPGPHGPGDLDNPDHGDNDDDGDNNDDGDDDGKHVRRPTRIDAGDPADGGLNITWLLAGGGVVTAAGGFAARRVALRRN